MWSNNYCYQAAEIEATTFIVDAVSLFVDLLKPAGNFIQRNRLVPTNSFHTWELSTG